MHLQDVYCNALCNPRRRFMDRVVLQVSVARRRLEIAIAE